MNPLKTTDLRPCDVCNGPIAPFFYRLKIEIRQLMLNSQAISEVLGTTQILGRNLTLGRMMSPDRDATIEMPGYNINKDLLLCQSCALEHSIDVAQLMVESEES